MIISELLTWRNTWLCLLGRRSRLVPTAIFIILLIVALVSPSPSSAYLGWEANNVANTPTDNGKILTNASGENEPSPPCIFPSEALFSKTCEASAFPNKDYVGEESPAVVASRRITNLHAGETLDAAADIQLSNTSAPGGGVTSDPVGASLQLVISTSPTSAHESEVIADITNSPDGEITDYNLEEHGILVGRGTYKVPTTTAGPVYVDAVVNASVPSGSTFGEHPCVDSPGEEIKGGGKNVCPLENNAPESTLSVQRFQPSENNSTPLTAEAVASPSSPGEGEKTTFPTIVGEGATYPYTPIWESSAITKMTTTHCPAEKEQEACAFVEAHADVSTILKTSGCSISQSGLFFLTQDKEIVAQAKKALEEVEEKSKKGEEPTYRWATGEKALEEKYPSFAAYEESAVLFDGEAATDVTGKGTGISESTSVHGGLSISATVPVSREILKKGESKPWYVALALNPEQKGCADSLTVNGSKSHAEALVFRPHAPGEPTWGESLGTRETTAAAGTELTSTAKSLMTDSVTVKAGDIIDVGADAPIEDSLSESEKQLVTMTPCLKLEISSTEYTIGNCGEQDLSSLQKDIDVFHSGSFIVPNTVTENTTATLSYTVQATATGHTSPAKIGQGGGDLDIEVYEPQYLKWEATNVLNTPVDNGKILTNSSGENEASPPCIFPSEALFSKTCEASAFPNKDYIGEESPAVVASRRITNLHAGEILDAATNIQLSNTSYPGGGATNDPVGASLQLVLSTSPTSAHEAEVVADMSSSPSAEITDYLLEHHGFLLSRGTYKVLSSITGPVYVDAVLTASVPSGSTFGEHLCVDSPGEEIKGGGKNVCPVENNAPDNTLSVQRFQPSENNGTPLTAEAVASTSSPGEGEKTTFAIAAGEDTDYPYTPVWESGEITKLTTTHCPAEKEQEACAFIEAHADVSTVLKNPNCSVEQAGQFFLTQDKEIVAQAKKALEEVEEKTKKGEEPTYRWATGEKALEEKYPSFAAYEETTVLFDGEAATNVTGVGTGISESTSVHSGLNISATVPVSRETLKKGESKPWYVALALNPEQKGCADSLTINGAKSHAEALVFRPHDPGEETWGESLGTREATAAAGTELTSTAKSLVTDALTVKAGDIIDVGADVPIEDSLSESEKQLVTMTPCLKLKIGATEYTIGSCAEQDLSILQKTAEIFHSGSFVVPATVTENTAATLSYTMQATATGHTSPAKVGKGGSDLDVEVYEPQP
jgi:hypothetical protein